ncbi:secondary thiamine-phosphate synthase enzyme YjbQ [Microvirga pudoricolor]|uniref:secondary thiamine-phosphate synthase enzyme YjbQ n=1 Tax=Microvirga pudoricolor TaxID=2778729 RepID=UPI00194F632E|nr:secondary thiamine-phosphate synthase enzyme YjbQ [Microvirga pudoricolor]MBM6592931.1 YjbQ family protein [Microvirga pudoricolor]
MKRSTVEPLSEGSVTQQATARLAVDTTGPGFTEITEPVARWVLETGILQGVLTVFCRHTSASLTIQENADPDVRRDLATALDRLAPRDSGYVHRAEGPDDMPAHIRAMLTGASLGVPVLEGQMVLGTWQGLYVVEHRDRPHRREIILHLLGA